MPRKSINVGKDELIKIINDFENKQDWENPSALFAAIAESDWAKSIGLKPSVIYLRVRDWKIELKTKKGKKGNLPNKSLMAGVPAPRKTRAEKFSDNPVSATHLNELDKNTPKRYKSLCQLIKSGSMTAAVKLNCLECTQYMRNEIRDCEVYECPLWLFRPYQKGIDNEEFHIEEELAVQGKDV